MILEMEILAVCFTFVYLNSYSKAYILVEFPLKWVAHAEGCC